jgi:hypothetical protein
MSTNCPQINTRICGITTRTRTVNAMGVFAGMMELTMVMIMPAMAVTMVVMALAIAETAEP